MPWHLQHVLSEDSVMEAWLLAKMRTNMYAMPTACARLFLAALKVNVIIISLSMACVGASERLPG